MEHLTDQVRRALKRWENLQNQRKDFDANYFRPLQKWVLPRSGYFSDLDDPQHNGRVRGRDIINNTAKRAHGILAAGMQSGLTSPFRRWFQLELDQRELSHLAGVQRYLDQLEELFYLVYATSNFYPSMHKFHKEVAGPATGVMLLEGDHDKVIRCKTLTMGEYCLAENQHGRVDTLYRSLWLSAENLLDQFGREAVGEKVLKMLDSGHQDDKLQVLHIVEPRRGRDHRRLDNRNFPWASLYILLAGEGSGGQEPGGRLLRESGYAQFPYIVGTWDKAAGETYGRGPGHDVLPEARALQEMEKDHALALEKKVNPPVKKPATLDHPVNALPGGVTPYDATAPQGLGPLYEVRPETRELMEKIRHVELRIEQAFYVDVFLASMGQHYGQPPTAEEIVERRQEKLLILGPIIERLTSEGLQPLFERVYHLMGEAGILPEPPPELVGRRFKVRLIGPLARAQQAAQAGSVTKTVAFFRELAQLQPEVLDLLDADQAARHFHELEGSTSRMVREQEEVERIRAARAQEEERQRQAAAAQQSLEAAGQAATAVKTLGDTPPEALEQMEAALGV